MVFFYYKLIRLSNIFFSYIRQEMSEEDKAELNQELKQSAHAREIFERINNKEILIADLKKLEKTDTETSWQRLQDKLASTPQPVITSPKPVWLRFATPAVAVIIMIIVAIYFMPTDKPDRSINDLTRHNQHSPAKPGLNTKTTKYHMQSEFKLPDSSMVKLNALSTIHYPITFPGKHRQVELTGEAYFEITPDKSKPFTVSVVNLSGKRVASVEVLGTHFNIHAYPDEELITASVQEGSVKLSSETGYITLKQGEQAVINKNGTIKQLSSGNVEEAIEWSNGNFKFNTDIKTIMRSLSRWYGVKIKYANEMPPDEYCLMAPRSAPIDKSLTALKEFDFQFIPEGDTIITVKYVPK